MIKIEPIITITKKGKEIKRYNKVIQESQNRLTPNINIGITPNGTRYYRAIMPDNSWSSLFMKKQNGQELIVDTVRLGSTKTSSVELRDTNNIITSDKFIEQKISYEGKFNQISHNQNVGKHSSKYVQDDVITSINSLKNKAMEFKKKETFGIKLLKLFK